MAPVACPECELLWAEAEAVHDATVAAAAAALDAAYAEADAAHLATHGGDA